MVSSEAAICCCENRECCGNGNEDKDGTSGRPWGGKQSSRPEDIEGPDLCPRVGASRPVTIRHRRCHRNLCQSVTAAPSLRRIRRIFSYLQGSPGWRCACNQKEQTGAKMSVSYGKSRVSSKSAGSNELCQWREAIVAEIKGHGLMRVPGKVPPSLFLRTHVLLSLFSSILYGPLPRALTWACRL
jgi:hypothetical protein